MIIDPDEALILGEIIFKKHFGQNFLINDEYAQKLVDAAELQDNGVVIEVGPGIGTITKHLLSKRQKVIAIEVDEDLMYYLNERFGNDKNLHVVNQDILKVNIPELLKGVDNYKVVASLPYNISKRVLQILLDTEKPPESITVLIQKEVAEDYTAGPPKATFLSNYTQIFGGAEMVEIVPKTEFHPEPKVDGAIIHITIEKPIFTGEKLQRFIKFLRGGFMNPRKQLLNNFSAMLHQDKEIIRKKFEDLKLNPKARAQEISFEEWRRLFEEFI